MILYKGTVYDSIESVRLLGTLQKDAEAALRENNLDREKLIDAVDKISGLILDGEFDDLIKSIDVDGIEEYAARAAHLLKKENVIKNLNAQLPDLPDLPEIESYRAPVGILFHISAGNIDVLPAYCVLCGLLCGNVNVLKLPSQDNGITLEILKRFIDIFPDAADFVFVFDTPSSDVSSMLTMARIADRIVVWGADEAVSAVRKLAPPNAGIVEWGHRISFAYIGSDYKEYPDLLEELAEHIIMTSQLLCSSCQRIYVDSHDPVEADRFCSFFLPLLQKARDRHPLRDMGAAAESTLITLTERTEASLFGKGKKAERHFFGRACSLRAKDDPELEISGFFGNCSVSSLPLENLFEVLRNKKGYLQTACIIADSKTSSLAENIMVRAGVNRITSPGKMSDTFLGEAHDGVFELSNYVRIINKTK
ncbi:MAG: acyl-CoA reductase [Clostridia bacterium]|nr:acyl-CoA reductase [Clostridia bacterium]